MTVIVSLPIPARCDYDASVYIPSDADGDIASAVKAEAYRKGLNMSRKGLGLDHLMSELPVRTGRGWNGMNPDPLAPDAIAMAVRAGVELARHVSSGSGSAIGVTRAVMYWDDQDPDACGWWLRYWDGSGEDGEDIDGELSDHSFALAQASARLGMHPRDWTREQDGSWTWTTDAS